MKKYIKKFYFTRDEAKYWNEKLLEIEKANDLESILLLLHLFEETTTFRHFKKSKIYNYRTYEEELGIIILNYKSAMRSDLSRLYRFISEFTYYPELKQIRKNYQKKTYRVHS